MCCLLQDMDFDRYYRSLMVARLSKDNTGGALARLAGGAGTSQMQPLASGEWTAEVRHDDSG